MLIWSLKIKSSFTSWLNVWINQSTWQKLSNADYFKFSSQVISDKLMQAIYNWTSLSCVKCSSCFSDSGGVQLTFLRVRYGSWEVLAFSNEKELSLSLQMWRDGGYEWTVWEVLNRQVWVVVERLNKTHKLCDIYDRRCQCWHKRFKKILVDFEWLREEAVCSCLRERGLYRCAIKLELWERCLKSEFGSLCFKILPQGHMTKSYQKVYKLEFKKYQSLERCCWNQMEIELNSTRSFRFCKNVNDTHGKK